MNNLGETHVSNSHCLSIPVAKSAGTASSRRAITHSSANAISGRESETGLGQKRSLSGRAALQLMDTDKNGKVSKKEFMRFMEAEFDLADRNKDGERDPKELQHFAI